MSSPRQVTRAEWDRMSWHARRSYERRGGVAPDGCAQLDRVRARLEAAGVDRAAVEVALGLRRGTPDWYGDAWHSEAAVTRELLTQLHAAGLRHLRHDDYSPP